MTQARPGDIFVLGTPRSETVGHRTVVYDTHVLSPREKDALRQVVSSHPIYGNSSSYRNMLGSGGPIQIFHVDSSWGNYGLPALGGVERRTWLYDPTTKEWCYLGRGPGLAPAFFMTPDPYGHPVNAPNGLYRRASR